MPVSALPFAAADLPSTIDRPRTAAPTRSEGARSDFAGALRDADSAARAEDAARVDRAATPTEPAPDRSRQGGRVGGHGAADDDERETVRTPAVERGRRATPRVAAPEATPDDEDGSAPRARVDDAAQNAAALGFLVAPPTAAPTAPTDGNADAATPTDASELAVVPGTPAVDGTAATYESSAPAGRVRPAPIPTPPEALASGGADSLVATDGDVGVPAAPAPPFAAAGTEAALDADAPPAAAGGTSAPRSRFLDVDDAPLAPTTQAAADDDAPAVAVLPNPRAAAATPDAAATGDTPLATTTFAGAGASSTVAKPAARATGRREETLSPVVDAAANPRGAASTTPDAAATAAVSGTFADGAEAASGFGQGSSAATVAGASAAAASPGAEAAASPFAAASAGAAPGAPAETVGLESAPETLAVDGAATFLVGDESAAAFADLGAGADRGSDAPARHDHAGGRAAVDAAAALGGPHEAAPSDAGGDAPLDTGPVAPDFSRALDELRGELRAGRREIVIRLDPPELGRLDVRLVQRGDAVVARVSAENPDVAEAFRRDRAALERLFVDQGVPLLGLDVRSGAFSDRGRPAGGFDREVAPAFAPTSRSATPVRAAVRAARPSDGALDLYA